MLTSMKPACLIDGVVKDVGKRRLMLVLPAQPSTLSD